VIQLLCHLLQLLFDAPHDEKLDAYWLYDIATEVEALDSSQIPDLDIESCSLSAHHRGFSKNAVSRNRFPVANLLRSLLRMCHPETWDWISI
jgi:hypothetical protein